MKQKYLLRIILCFLVGFVLTGCASQNQQIKQTENIDSQLLEISNEVNKKCPMQVDKDTRLDNTVAPGRNVFQYNYTILNYSKNEINVEVLKNSLYKNILPFIKTNPDIKVLRDNNVIFVYYYKDRDGLFILKLVFKPEDYK